MRWLIVCSMHHWSQGGIGAYVAHFVKYACAAGWRVDLVTRPSDVLPRGAVVHPVETPDRGSDFEARVARLREIERIRPYRYGIWAKAAAEKLLELELEADAVEFADCFGEAYVALRSRRVRERWISTPMMIYAHSAMFVEEEINQADMMRFGRGVYHEWERSALREADGVAAASRLLLERLPPARASAVLPYPIEPLPIAPPVDSERIVVAGTIQPRKGIDTWVRSLNSVFSRRPRAEAVLIGPDTPTSPDGTSMIEHVFELLAPKHGDRLKWIGPASYDELIEEIDRSAVVVVPSVFDTFSLMAADALGRGRPVVVSSRVGIREHVEGLDTFPVHDAEALAEAQLRILADRAAARRRALNAREQLAEACAPLRHLERRAEFARSLTAHPSEVGDEAAPDAIDQMAAFIDSVEERERAVGAGGGA
ncbi:MAG: glycosyltransferase family 4 protein [Phycisphaerales bacterium]|nr:MAG: glycosyltransferase family 4 protein [Phycisphaerales bacterium]